MFFIDDTAAGAPDPGAKGFMDIFDVGKTGAEAQDANSDTPEAQAGATGADDASREERHDGGTLTPEELVATRLAASLAADGIEFPDPDGDDEGEGDQPQLVDLSTLTPEELTALAAEALKLKEEQATGNEEREVQAVQAKIADAEATAIERVAAAFEAQVLVKSATHYKAEYRQKLASIVRDSAKTDNPAQYIIEEALKASEAVHTARRKFESAQATKWEQVVEAERIKAQRSVPELRQLVAKRLARHFNLPDAAIAKINEADRDLATFEARAQELADYRDALGSERTKSRTKAQQDANDALRKAPIRTPSSARVPGGKAPSYKGSPQEGLAILSLMHSNS